VDDTPFVNDGADTSLRKAVSLLNKIEAKTGSTTITGPVTVTNEVEVTNSSGSPIPISGTIGTFQSNLVNQGAQFSWGSSTGPGSFGVFDAGTDADYVEFALGGGGGGFTFNLSLSLSNSPFVSGASTTNPEVVVFADRYPVANLETVYRFSNTALQSGTNGYYVLGLVHFGIKYRYVRLDVTGAGGGGYGGSFVSYKSFGPFHPTGGYQKNKILNRVPIAGVVDINSCTRELPVTGTFWQTTQPVSLASAPVTPVTDNGGSLTVDGTVTVNDMTSGNAKTKIVDSVGADVSYITAGTAGTPSASVLSVQGISGGTSLPISGTVDTGLTQPLTDTQLRAAVVPVSLASVPSHAVTQATAANLNATVVGSGSFTAAQATASSLKAQAQILDSAGSLLTYAATGTAGTPGVDVVSIQGVSSGVAVTVSGPVTDTQLRASAISVSDRGSVGQATVTTFTSTSSLVLMASNSARKLLTVFNEGAGVLYLLYGAGTASITNYSVRINSGDYLEIEKYTGAVTGIFGTAGTARATEIS